MRRFNLSRRRVIGGASALAGGVLLSDLGFTPSWVHAQESSSALFAYNFDPVSLDPTICSGLNCAYITDHIYEGLTRFDRGGNIEPCLATSWENPDPLVWVFQLREGVKFHNGADLTAEDVKFSIERVIDPELPGSNRPYFEAVREVEIVDELTVNIHLNRPYVALIGSLAYRGGAIMNKAWAEEQLAAGAAELAHAAVGTGPYSLVEYVPGDRIDLAAFGDYWDGDTPHIEQVTWKIMPEMETRVAALTARTASYAQIDSVASQLLANVSHVERFGISGFGMPVSIHNVRRAPYDNLLVRQAIAMGVDRTRVIENVYGGEGSLTGPVQTGFGNWYIPVEELPYEVDKEGARALLAEAGYPNGFDTEILGLDTWPYNDVGVVYQAELQSIGINASLVQMEFGAWLDKIHEFDFDTHVNGYAFNPDPAGILGRSFECGSSGNFPGFCNETYDSLLGDLLAEPDPDARAAIAKEMQWLLLDDAPFIWWSTQYDHYAITDQITNFTPAIHSFPREVFKDVTLANAN